MSETTAGSNVDLITQLRIDRDDVSVPRKVPVRVWAGAAAVGILILGAALGFGVFAASPPSVRTARAEPVTVGSGAQSRAHSRLDAAGYIVARRRATVSSKITGKVMEVLIEEGQQVAEGEVIARLDDSNLRASLEEARARVAEAEASLQAALTAHDDARPIFERSEKQRTGRMISDQAFDEARASFNTTKAASLIAQRALESARARLALSARNVEDTVVRAPFAGVVTDKAAQPGEMVSPVSAGGGFTRTGIGTIVDMSSLELQVDVSENFINRVSAKQPALINLNAYPDWDIPGEVIATIPSADRAKATVKVRIALALKDSRILPEMGARVSFLDTSRSEPPQKASQQVVVPADAVLANGAAGVVFVVRNGILERREVRLSGRSERGLLVTGLAPDTEVVVGTLSDLRSGTKVRVEENSSG